MSAPLVLLALVPLQGPGGDLPFERLGQAWIDAGPAPEETVTLGAFELSLPTQAVTADGELERARRPRGWKDLAQLLVALQSRWVDELELEDESLAAALILLEDRARGLPAKGKLTESEAQAAAGRRVRAALLGTEAPELAVRLILAPTRAHFVALVGAEGITRPWTQDALWNSNQRRSVTQRLSQTTLVITVEVGPASLDAVWDKGEVMAAFDLQQQVVHASSHTISDRTLTSAPSWLHEALAIRDCIALVGADETLCTGHPERDETIFDHSPVAMWSFAFANTKRSPYRGKAARDRFVRALRMATNDDEGGGFMIMDLERSRPVLVAPGPFLAPDARVPEAVTSGSDGLRWGFAEFFRAYCTAFVEWLSNQEGSGGENLLAVTLRALRAPVVAEGDRARQPPRLETVLRAHGKKTLGVGRDPERDLEAAFVAWLR